MAKPGIHTPNAITERTLAVLAELEKQEFAVRDVLRREPSISYRQCYSVICHRLLTGALDKVRRGVFIQGGIRMRTRLPHAQVAEAVWAALWTSREQKPMRLAEIVGEAEAYIGRRGLSVYRTVPGILTCWFRSGHLERTGKRLEYAYRLKSGVKERPVATR